MGLDNEAGFSSDVFLKTRRKNINNKSINQYGFRLKNT
jgi:hypothetical protein